MYLLHFDSIYIYIIDGLEHWTSIGTWTVEQTPPDVQNVYTFQSCIVPQHSQDTSQNRDIFFLAQMITFKNFGLTNTIQQSIEPNMTISQW